MAAATTARNAIQLWQQCWIEDSTHLDEDVDDDS
jgi:hypothetical protein